MTDLLQLRRDEGVLTLLLNNPDGKNALTEAMIERMIDVLEDSLNDQAVRIVVLRGAGKDFCTGFDLDEFYALASGGPSEHQSRAERLARVFRLLHGALKPTVAVVQGRALGVGASLAITCDVVVASTTASFAFPSALLRRHMSDKQAFELVATGRTIRAEEARLYGLVSRVVPEEGFEAVTGSTLRHLGCCAPETFATIKQLFTDLEGKSFEDALALSTALNARAHSTQAFREAAEQYRSMA
jgi:enoyl-CoA hydratase